MGLNKDGILDRVLDNFISDKGTYLELHRPTKARTANGGRTQTGEVVIDPQLFRIMPFKRRLTVEYRDLPADRLTKIEYILIFNESTDILKGDWFLYDPLTGNGEEQWDVEFITALNFNRKQAGIMRREKVPPDAP